MTSIAHDAPLKKTFLHGEHISLGAKMAAFGGYEMPIQYESIISEHFAARRNVALFDTCHMGEFLFGGTNVVAELENLLTCGVGSLGIGKCRYGFICNEAGGVIDDQVIYRFGPTEFFMVVNAATKDFDFEWIAQHMSSGTSKKNLSSETAKMDLQGPASPRIASRLLEQSLAGMKFYEFRHNRYRGKQVLVSRTGYTGEIGFEFYCSPDLAQSLWRDCLEAGAKPAGLGSRDTLRLEMGMPLYGHELDTARNPSETGFVRAIDATKKFIGSARVLDPLAATSRLVGLALDGRRAGRSGDSVLSSDGQTVGAVTSGSYSPSLQKAIALGYVSKKLAAPGTRLLVDTGKQKLPAVVFAPPFYAQATGRKPIEQFL